MVMSSEPSGFTNRSMGKSVLFMIVSLGLYGIYWIHQYHKELKAELGAEYNPTTRTVGLFIPLYNFLVMWKTSKDTEAALDQSAGLMFALWLFLAPAWWFMLQSSINERASA